MSDNSSIQANEVNNESFKLKQMWDEKTKDVPSALDGKTYSEVMDALLVKFEEFREGSKSQLRGDKLGVGITALRILDGTSDIIRSFEKIQFKKAISSKDEIMYSNTIEQTGKNRHREVKDEIRKVEQTIEDLEKHHNIEQTVKNRSSSKFSISISKPVHKLGSIAGSVLTKKNQDEQNFFEDDIEQNTKKDNIMIDNVTVSKDHIQNIIQHIGDLIAIIDETFPRFLPKPIPKQDIPLDNLELFQDTLKNILQEDDSKLVKGIRDQWDRIDTVVGQYGISIVCAEDEITAEQRISWFDEKFVKSDKITIEKTQSPAFVRSDKAILKGLILVPRAVTE